MRRGFWFVAGAGVGVYAVVKARRVAESLTPDGIRDRAAGVALGAQLFAEEVRDGMRERENELRERFGDLLDGPWELEAGPDSRPGAAKAAELPPTSSALEGRD